MNLNSNERNLIIVDDDPRICRVIKRMADQLGLQSYSMNFPALFESFCSDIKPDIIFLDIVMPEVNVVDMLQRIAKQHPEAEIVIMSGLAPSVLITTVEIGHKLGLNMRGYLSKPFDFNDVSALLTVEHKA